MRASPRMSPTLSGLLNDVVYKEEEVEMSPEEASLLQEEINNISEQIESDTTDLSIVSKSLNRVLELTEDMNTAVDTDTTDKYTAGLLLSEFASIYKDTMGQEFLYSKNLSDNPLEVKQILTAGLQSAGNFIETLKKIAKKIWESLKAGYAWFVSKMKEFVKWIATKLSLMKNKADKTANVLATAEAVEEASKKFKKEALDIINKIEKEQEENSIILDELIKDAENLGKSIDKIAEDKAKKIKSNSRVKQDSRVVLKNSRELLGFSGEIKTKKAAKEFAEIVLSGDIFKVLHKNITEDENLLDSVIKMDVVICASNPVLYSDLGSTSLDLSKDIISKINKEIYPLYADSNKKHNVYASESLESYMTNIIDVVENFTNIIRERAELQYDTILELFKKAKSLALDGGDRGEYIVDMSILEAVPTKIEVDVSSKNKSGTVSLAAGGILGPVKNTIPVIVENGIGRISTKTVEDSIKGLKPIDNEIVNLNAVGKKFEEALKETEWFMDYLLNATKEELASKGENLINNLFVVIQNLNAISPSVVISVVTKVISAGSEFYDNLNLEARILEAKKINK